ncbi:GATA-type domain-containing protein [Aphelenchoides fujianensis]|nr:GATA-type domain-containing protein [Aphelenchoides fujianensis]
MFGDDPLNGFEFADDFRMPADGFGPFEQDEKPAEMTAFPPIGQIYDRSSAHSTTAGYEFDASAQCLQSRYTPGGHALADELWMNAAGQTDSSTPPSSAGSFGHAAYANGGYFFDSNSNAVGPLCVDYAAPQMPSFAMDGSAFDPQGPFVFAYPYDSAHAQPQTPACYDLYSTAAYAPPFAPTASWSLDAHEQPAGGSPLDVKFGGFFAANSPAATSGEARGSRNSAKSTPTAARKSKQPSQPQRSGGRVAKPVKKKVTQNCHLNSRCSNCGTQDTTLWRRNSHGGVECNACNLYFRKNGKRRPEKLQSRGIMRRARNPRQQSDSDEAEDSEEHSAHSK